MCHYEPSSYWGRSKPPLKWLALISSIWMESVCWCLGLLTTYIYIYTYHVRILVQSHENSWNLGKIGADWDRIIRTNSENLPYGSLCAIHRMMLANQTQATPAILVRFQFHKSKLVMNQYTYQFHSIAKRNMYRGKDIRWHPMHQFWGENWHVAWSWVTTISH